MKDHALRRHLGVTQHNIDMGVGASGGGILGKSESFVLNYISKLEASIECLKDYLQVRLQPAQSVTIPAKYVKRSKVK